MAPDARASGASAPFEPYPVPQRTLDLKREHAYFRVRLELRPTGASNPPAVTRRAFETALTHALARAHGVVGGAIHVHHIAFRAANASDPTLPGETNAAAGVGTFRVHRDHAAKVATAVTMLAETHDGSPCVARTCAAASSPHAVAFDARAATARAVGNLG